MRTFSKTLVLLIVAVLLASICGCSFAAEPEKLFALQVMRKDNNLNVILYSDDTVYHDANEFDVTLDAQKMTDLSMTSLIRSADHGTSYFIVIDPSNAIGKTTLASMRAVAQCFVDLMKSNDNAVILDTRYMPEALSLSANKSELTAQIEACAKPSKETHLYENITKAAVATTISTELKERMCLVLLSAGKDESTLRWVDVEKAVNESFNTVYTMAVSTSGNTVAVNDVAKNLGALAESSKGGVAYYYGFKEGASADEITASVAKNENMFYMLSIPLKGVAPPSGDAELTVSLAYNNKVLKDSIVVPRELLAGAESDALPINSPDPIPDPDPDPDPDHWYDFLPDFMKENVYLWLAICAAILVLIVVIVVMLAKNAKKSKVVESDIAETTTRPDMPEEKTIPIPDATSIGPMQKEKTVAITPGLIVQMTNVATREIYEARMVHTLLVGRSGGGAQLTIPNDPTISERQCLLTWRHGLMTIEDQNSTNGTDVNGHIKIKSEMRIQVGDSIRMGKTTVILSWVDADM